jgi:hypothetical protein
MSGYRNLRLWSVGHTWARSSSRRIRGDLNQMAYDLRKYEAGYTAGTREDDLRYVVLWARRELGPRGHGHMADRSWRVPAVRHTARCPGLPGGHEGRCGIPVGGASPHPQQAPPLPSLRCLVLPRCTSGRRGELAAGARRHYRAGLEGQRHQAEGGFAAAMPPRFRVDLPERPAGQQRDGRRITGPEVL